MKQIFFLGELYLEIYNDHTFTKGSSDNANTYQKQYFDVDGYKPSSVYGIKAFKNKKLLSSVVIGSSAGATALHDKSILINDDRFAICCSNHVFCFSLPDLCLLWRTETDWATCFGIYRHNDSYIVHGELMISMLSRTGKILWQQSGADIFTVPDGIDNLIITDEYILVKDWNYREYKIDFDGNFIA